MNDTYTNTIIINIYKDFFFVRTKFFCDGKIHVKTKKIECSSFFERKRMKRMALKWRKDNKTELHNKNIFVIISEKNKYLT